MRVKYTKIPPDVVRQNRNFYKNHVKKAFVAYCAYEGKFDDVLTKEEIERAKRGILPEDLNIHHKVPLSGSNELFINDFENLAVIHKKTHEFINKYIFAPQLRQLLNEPWGTEIEIEIPNYDMVDRDGILKERMIAKERLNRRKNGKQNNGFSGRRVRYSDFSAEL